MGQNGVFIDFWHFWVDLGRLPMDSSVVNDPLWAVFDVCAIFVKNAILCMDTWQIHEHLILSVISRMTQKCHFYDQNGILSTIGSYLTLSQYILALDMTLLEGMSIWPPWYQTETPSGRVPHMSQDVIFLVRLTEMSSYGGMWAGFAQIHANLTLFYHFLSAYRWVVVSTTI